MTQAKRNKRGYYPIEGIGELASVTTKLKILAKEALIFWAVEQGVKLYKKHGDVSRKDLFRLFKDISGRASRRGTGVHKWIKVYFDTGVFPKEPKQHKGYYRAVKKFFEENEVKPFYYEIVVYSKKYSYAGTLDFFGLLNGDVVIADWKTGKSLYKEVELQLSAYLHALFESVFVKNDPLYILPSLPKIRMEDVKLKAVLFRKDGTYKVCPLEQEVELWEALHKIWLWWNKKST